MSFISGTLSILLARSSSFDERPFQCIEEGRWHIAVLLWNSLELGLVVREHHDSLICNMMRCMGIIQA
jgi:hypothetical protein